MRRCPIPCIIKTSIKEKLDTSVLKCAWIFDLGTPRLTSCRNSLCFEANSGARTRRLRQLTS